MRSTLVCLVVCLSTSLACMGGGEDRQPEIDGLVRQVAEKDAALAQSQSMVASMEEAMKACGCKPPAPPVAVVAPVPAAAPAAAPTPAPAVAGFGEVEIKSPPSFKMILDGNTMTYNVLKSIYVARDVPSGAHRVEVQIGTSDIIHSESISVEPGKRTRYQWKELPTLSKGTDQLEQLATVNMD